MRAAAACAVGVWLALLSPAAPQDTPDAPDTLRESYRDWVLSCALVDPAGPADPALPVRRCEIMQELHTAETGQRVLRLALVPGDAGSASVALVTPFGVRVADGVGIATGGTQQARVDFLTCLKAGCLATGSFDAATLDVLSAAETATITMNATGGETLTLDLSLAGFAAAWRRLDVLAQE